MIFTGPAPAAPVATDGSITLGRVDVGNLLRVGVSTMDTRREPGTYWVREAFAVEDWDCDDIPDVVIYRAGGHKFTANSRKPAALSDEIMALSEGAAWKHPNEMRRELARLTVIVERNGRDVRLLTRSTNP